MAVFSIDPDFDRRAEDVELGGFLDPESFASGT
jgi:hypothetical protein